MLREADIAVKRVDGALTGRVDGALGLARPSAEHRMKGIRAYRLVRMRVLEFPLPWESYNLNHNFKLFR
jgi:hypothetical protein